MPPVGVRAIAREVQLTAPQQHVEFHGHSMAPFLRDGDRLGVDAVAWNAIAPGDIVTFRLEERFPTFRVIERRASKLVLRGDNWPFADFDVWPDDLLGRVVSRTRHGSTLTRTDWRWKLQAQRALLDASARRHKRRASAQANRILRVAGRLLRGQPARRDEPSGLQLNISASCNLGCRMCPYLGVHDNTAYGREMTDDTFRRMLPTIATLPSLQIAGSGEPLFNRKLISFIEQARAVNPRIEISLTTNGTLLTETVLKELIRVKVNRIAVSLDGVSGDMVGSIRLGVNLGKVMNNLATLKRLKDETGSALPKLRGNFMVGFGSYAELPEFLRQARRIGMSEVQVLEVLDGTEESFAQNLLNSLHADQARNLREAIKLAQGSGITLLLPTTQHDSCLHPYTPHVSEAGDVSPCCFVDYDGRTLWDNGTAVRMPKVDYGNVNDVDLQQIWRSPSFTAFRSRTKRGDFTDFCRTCHTVRVATSRAVHQAID